MKGHLARNCDKTDKDLTTTVDSTVAVCNTYLDITGESVDARATAEVQGMPEYYNDNIPTFSWSGEIMLCTVLTRKSMRAFSAGQPKSIRTRTSDVCGCS